MSNHKYNQNLLIGVAVAAGILGTLTSVLGFKKNNKRRSRHPKNFVKHILENGEGLNKKFVLGSVAGGLVGATAALLLAPKSGTDLIHDLSHPFSQRAAKIRLGSHQSSAHKSASHKKKVFPTIKRSHRQKAGSKIVEKKESRSSGTKKTPSKHRTATAAHKIAIHEKNANEVKEA
jgi:gas vesicle protein